MPKPLVNSDKFKKIPCQKVVETLLEVHLFAGFPAAIEGFSFINSVLFQSRASLFRNQLTNTKVRAK